MGEVYRAHDAKLNRDVAIKVLLPAVADDPDRLARFSREAQVLASLNHPNIAHIHGLEESGGIRALVMELVEGPTLADRIAQGAIPLDEALPIAKQIAEALEAAHEQGIVHRDLKPANIKVREDGTVKVLDFGLAKAMESPASSAQAMNSPTISMHATQAGIILGTAAYMSPEQARGKSVDRRADIWALGVVLFEMLTGRRAFDAEDISATLAFVITKEPDWSALPANTPAAIRRLVRRCLEKDPKRRLQAIGDARVEIDDALTAPAAELSPTMAAPIAPRRVAPLVIASVLGALLVAALGALSFGLGIVRLREAPTETPTMRFTIAPPDGITIAGPPAISPDGRRVVFQGSDGALWMRSLDALAVQRVPGTEGGAQPFWSPDGRSVAFFAGGKLKKIDVAGGPAVTLCDAAGSVPAGGSWSPNGVIVFRAGAQQAIQQVPVAGGEPAPATILDPSTHDVSHAWPHFLPDGRHFLYVSTRVDGSRSLVAGSLEAKIGTALSVPVDYSGAEYATPGVLLFVRGTTLMRQAFDAARLTATGDPAPVAESVVPGTTSGARFSVSSTGTLVYVAAGAQEKRRLVWVDRKGGVTPLALPPGAYGEPGLSPDGRQVALAVTDTSGTHIWVYDLERGTLGKRTFEGTNTYPIWTRDGQFLTYSTGGQSDPLMQVRADGSGRPEPLVTTEQRPGTKIATSWSADGKQLAFQSVNDVVVREANGSLHPAVATPAIEREGRFAPSGHWLAYRSNETGRDEVYVQSYPAGHGKWQISTDGGAQPMWAPGGGELFYKNGNRMMVVAVQAGATFTAGTPRALFEMPLPERTPGDPSRFIVSPDAKRFLVLTTASSDDARTTPPLNVVLNWPGEVAAKPPAR